MGMRHMLMPLVALLAVQRASCAGTWEIPGGLSAASIPQFILFTHDDNTDATAIKYMSDIYSKHTNPNRCRIQAAFYSTTSMSTCAAVKSLHAGGHEIAEHTVHHNDLHLMSDAQKKAEIVGARDWLVKTCKIPAADVVGHRSPYLSDDAGVRKILSTAGFLYDSSIQEVFNSPTSPSATKRCWPYKLSAGVKQIYSCNWFDNGNHCSASERYPNLYEVPMNYPMRSSDNPSSPDCMDVPNPYAIYKAELDRNMKGNKAPVGIFVHTSTGYLTQSKNRAGINQFLSYALAKPGVWVVTPRQLLDWQRAPVPASKMAAFMAKYHCTK